MPFSLIPDQVFARYTDLTPQVLKDFGVELLLCDLDYTLAPRSMADAAKDAAFSKVGSSAFFKSVTAEEIVMDILVPVSPSGTGKTFSSLMACL